MLSLKGGKIAKVKRKNYSIGKQRETKISGSIETRYKELMENIKSLQYKTLASVRKTMNPFNSTSN